MKELENLKIGFIGAGNMGGAILKGIVESGTVNKTQIYVSEFLESVKQKWDSYGVNVAISNKKLAEVCDVVFLAVKPQMMRQALSDCAEELADKFVITIAAGMTADTIRTLSGAKRVLRIMPNTPAMVGKGATLVCNDLGLAEDEMKVATTLLSSLGTVSLVPEKLIDAGSAISGCGPAFVAMFIEAMADGGVREGLPRATAYELAAQTVLGTAELYMKTDMLPAGIKDMVTSPGGTTIEGVYQLEKGGMRAAVMDAVHEASEKNKKLA